MEMEPFIHEVCLISFFFFFSSLQAVEEEDKMTPEQLAIKNVGKQVISFFLSLSLYCRWFVIIFTRAGLKIYISRFDLNQFSF